MDVNITLGDDSNQKHGAIRHLSESSGGGTSDQALPEETATAMASASDAASTPGNTMGTRARMADEDVSSDNTGVSLASSTPLQAKEILSEEDSVKTASSDSDLETSRRTFLQHQVAPGAADGVTERVDTIRSALPAVHPTESDLDDPGGDSTSDNSRGRAAATHSEKESIPGTERGIPIESQEGSECRTNEEAGVDVDWPSCSTSKHVASNGPSAQGTPQEVAESEDTIHGKPPLVSIEDDAAATEISSVPQTPSIVDPSRSLGYSAGAGKGMEVENAGGGHVEQPFSGALQAQAMAEAARAQAALHATATAAAGIVGGAGGAVNAAAAAAVSAAGAAAAAAAAAAGEAFSIADGDGAPEALTIMSRDEVSSWIQRDAPHWILIRYQLYVLGFLLLMILILWRRYGSMISVLYEDLDGPISLDRPRLSERLQPIEEHPPTTRPRTQGGSPGRGGQGRPSAGRRSPRSRS